MKAGEWESTAIVEDGDSGLNWNCSNSRMERRGWIGDTTDRLFNRCEREKSRITSRNWAIACELGCHSLQQRIMFMG